MSIPLPIAQRLEPLLAAAHQLGGCHLTLFGSARRRPLAEVADLDLHLVLPEMNRSAWGAIVAAAKETAQVVAAAAGRRWRVELRHGPFKPAPGATRDLQLHLLLDDQESAARIPCALLAHRAATGQLLVGQTLLGLRTDCGLPTTWLSEARDGLARWRDALAAGEIPFRLWRFNPGPRLADSRVVASDPWALACLLRGAAGSADLHYRAALWMAGQPCSDDLARPLRSQLSTEPPWRDLAGCWDRVREEAITVLERRLGHLAGLGRQFEID